MNKIEFKPSVMLNPVPAVMISSRNKEGKNNVFTVSWVNTICTRPPMLSISIRPERLSYEYIKESMEFVVNVPSTDLTYETDFCGVKTGKKIDKIKELNLNVKDASNVNAYILSDCPVNIECKVRQIIPLGSHDMFIADVVGSHINEDMLDEKGKIHFEYGNLLSYAHGEYFPMAKKPIGRFGYSTKLTKEETLKLRSDVQTKSVEVKEVKDLKKDETTDTKKKIFDKNKNFKSKPKKNKKSRTRI